MLGVRGHHVDAPVVAVEFGRIGHPDALREALTERARGRLEAGKPRALRVPLEARAELPQRAQLLEREVPSVGHRGVADRADVARGEQQSVPVGPVRPRRVVPHHFEVEGGEHIGHVERAGAVAGPCRKERLDDAPAHGIRVAFELEAALG